VDFTTFVIYFGSQRSFDRWSGWFEEKYEVPVPIAVKEGLEAV